MPITKLSATRRWGVLRDKINEIIKVVNDADIGGEGFDGSDIEDALAALEARQTKQVVVAGTTADTDIAIAGIDKDDDEIVGVVEIDLDEEKVKGITDRTAEAKITADGKIQLDTTDTTGSSLIVTYVDADGNA